MVKSQLNSSLHFAKWSSQGKYVCLKLSLALLLSNDAPCFQNLNLSDQLEYQKNAHEQPKILLTFWELCNTCESLLK